MKLGILIPTRNRPGAVVECCATYIKSKDIYEKRYNSSVDSICLVCDNYTFSDYKEASLDDLHINWLRRHGIEYIKNIDQPGMAGNYDYGVGILIDKYECNYIAIVADRRLITPFIFTAFRYINSICAHVLIIDHQNLWISNSQLNYLKTYQYQLLEEIVTPGKILDELTRVNTDNYTPRGFNCLVSSEYYSYTRSQFGSYYSGASPDINFLARYAVNNFTNAYIYDAPCIAVNCRFVQSSVGQSAANGSDSQSKLYALAGQDPRYPKELSEFLLSSILGDICSVISDFPSQVCAHSIINDCIKNTNSPSTLASYQRKKQQLTNYIDKCISKKKITLESGKHYLKQLQITPHATPTVINYDPHLAPHLHPVNLDCLNKLPLDR